jgi:Asp-tRNA(Asn)/Glu-tRNA(Gln) amidotransferase A subunit family amidase
MLVDPEPLGPLARELATDGTDVTTYVERRCERIDAVDPQIRAFVAERDRQGRLERAASYLATRYDDPADRPPLYGVPVGIKDIYGVEGFPTRAGSELPPSEFTGPEATLVSRLRDAGAIVAGKTVTTEFAYAAPGPTRNPHDVTRTPGGSSSGSAAAVAAGMCPLAIGSQTIGSTLRPAAFCGVVGFKPSYGRAPLDGVLPLSQSVDHAGLFTADVEGARLASRVLCDDWVGATDVERPVCGVPEGPYLDRTSAAGRSGFEAALERLSTAGYEIRRVPAMEDFEAVERRHETLVAAEFALVHADRFDRYPDGISDSSAALARDGRGVGVGELADARAGRRELRDRLTDRMAEHGVDVWLSPAAVGPAPEGIDDTGDPVMNLPWTHAGMPSVSLPAGTTDAGLPLGLQCVGRAGADERLLAWATPTADVLADVE